MLLGVGIRFYTCGTAMCSLQGCGCGHSVSCIKYLTCKPAVLADVTLRIKPVASPCVAFRDTAADIQFLYQIFYLQTSCSCGRYTQNHTCDTAMCRLQGCGCVLRFMFLPHPQSKEFARMPSFLVVILVLCTFPVEHPRPRQRPHHPRPRPRPRPAIRD